MTTCSGRDAVSGERIAVEYDSLILFVDPVLDDPMLHDKSVSADDRIFLAPGFIDLQVNGFAGVDFNSPAAPNDEIERAIQAVFSTGVTRLFPTVITGDPSTMLAALRNLASARESLPH